MNLITVSAAAEAHIEFYFPGISGNFINISIKALGIHYNPGQENNDGDSGGDVCDTDDDNDAVLDSSDNCAWPANPAQENLDGDSMGDACDDDDDGDAYLDGVDCRPLDASVWTPPGSVADLSVSKAPADNLAWSEPLFRGGDYAGALKALAALRAAVDEFFDKVMVMAEDERLRRNRLALLSLLSRLFLGAADISRLQPRQAQSPTR